MARSGPAVGGVCPAGLARTARSAWCWWETADCAQSWKEPPPICTWAAGWCLQARSRKPSVASLLGVADVAVVSQHGSAADAALSPLKLFEYMAAGKAIVAAGGAGIERIINNGVNGLLVPAGDAQALARGIAEVIENDELRASLGHAARQQAIEKHSWAGQWSGWRACCGELPHRVIRPRFLRRRSP